MKNTQTWLPGIEWLRVIFIAFVLAMHMNVSKQFAGDSAAIHVADLMYFQLFCTAAPGFLLIASYLSVRRSKADSKKNTHVIDLICLYVFWVGAWTLHTRPQLDLSLVGVILYIVRGGGWAFYFFFALIQVQIITSLVERWSMKRLAWGLIVSQFVIATIFLGLAKNGYFWTRCPTYWWPINVIAIPFVAVLISKSDVLQMRVLSSRLGILPFLGVVYAVSTFCEWSFAAPTSSNNERAFLPEYLRVSPLCMAVIMLLIAIRVRGTPPFLIRWISRNSLGIFCLHVFVLAGVHRLTKRFVESSLMADLITISIIIVGGALASELLRKCFKSRLV